jgi:hypothetical protein
VRAAAAALTAELESWRAARAVEANRPRVDAAMVCVVRARSAAAERALVALASLDQLPRVDA